MSYPFGSGMPQPNNSGSYPPLAPFGAGVRYSPMQGQAPYPTSNPGYGPQNPGYPPQNPAYPSQNSGYPPQNPVYPPQNPAYPSQNPAYPTPNSSYPPQPGYPPQQSGFPSQPMYPTHQSGNQSNLGYPPQQSSYPSQTLHYPPGAQPGYPPSRPTYPNSTKNVSSAYPTNPSNTYLSQGYPTQSSQSYAGATNMANCFAEMQQSHIKDIRKENKSKGNPTVVPATNFDPVADAKALRKAMKGFGTDEDTLIKIICGRSNEQRQIIQREFKTNFGKDLIDDIKSETSGNFENLLVALLTPIVNFYVKEIHDAMSGIGTDEDVLIEVLCSMSNYEIHTIKNAYERLYGKNLESELISETSGNFKRLLISLCNGARDESGTTDLAAAQRDARDLLNAGELRVGTDESTFNMVLCQRNYEQIKLICEEYKRMTGHTLEKAIKNEFSGDIMEGLIAILQCTSNKAEFFASRLKKSMAGFGTNDTQLIRLIVTRCEIDLNDIKTTFERLYGKPLRSWIKGDTSGHYKHALYALIGEQRSS